MYTWYALEINDWSADWLTEWVTDVSIFLVKKLHTFHSQLNCVVSMGGERSQWLGAFPSPSCFLFPFPSFPLPFPFHPILSHLLPSRRGRPLKRSYGVWGSAASSLSGSGRSPGEAWPPNVFWCIVGIHSHLSDRLMMNNFLCLFFIKRMFPWYICNAWEARHSIYSADAPLIYHSRTRGTAVTLGLRATCGG